VADDTPGRSLTQQLAHYWADARFEDLPAATVELAKLFLLDTLAACVAGAGTEVVRIALATAHAAAERQDGSAPVWGASRTLPAPLAAMVNGTSAHALELDDFGGCGHSGAVVIPAIGALAAGRRVSGREFLVALVCGYDIAARTLEGAGGYRRVNDLGWHSTGVFGSFGAAAAAARILRLEPARFADALGIAGTFTGGIWAFLRDGAMTKRFHPGKASENGLMAAMLAANGMSGPGEVLDAPWGGLFSTYAPQVASPRQTLAGLGADFLISRSGIKPYACCRGLHSAVDAMRTLIAQAGASSADIVGVEIAGNEQYALQFDRPRVSSLLEAQFSAQYTVAVTAVLESAGLDAFSPLQSEHPEVARLMACVRVLAGRTLRIGEYPPVRLRLADGRILETQVNSPRGAPDNPLSLAEVRAKAGLLIDPVLGAGRSGLLADAIASLEAVDDVREMLRLCVPSA
jgi:2-methylcitrate dehydratase PrpD